MSQLPAPLRAALGLAATAVDRIRTLPQDGPELPVHLVGNAMQLSLRAQQRYVELTNRGDELLGQMRGTPEEPPAWATFDEDAPAQESAPRAPARPTPPPAATPAPAAKKAAAKKAPVTKAPATRAATKKVAAKKAPAKKAPAAKAAATKAAAKKAVPRPVAKRATPPALGTPAIAPPSAGSNAQAKSVFDLTSDPGDTPS